MQLPASWNRAIASINSAHRFGRIPVLLLFLWATLLWWGERSVWHQSAKACAWDRWEQWPGYADPHHVLLVADPQIVDPHTYTGRPWPLSALTYWITDQYMRRSYGALLQRLQPHTTLFLGDLFDGGREWATREYTSPDERYKSYDMDFWLKEYSRFMDMFIKTWYLQEFHHMPSSEGRRILLSLPGNHDLGFGTGIDLQVKSRFDAHFGPLNRLDVLGNHTFVSVDTVSLSAMDQIDPATGSSGAGDGTAASTKSSTIWKPVDSFLESARDLKSRAVRRRIEDLRSISHPGQHQASIGVSSSLFPTILLSHVPLFRNSDVSCGPLRERGNAIPLSAGYQYQNVLTPLVSADLVKHLEADQISMIYSGDDHDYCEIEHGEFTGRIKEITVKSTSMAMGVSKPGVLLVSLWNPVDMEAIVRGTTESRTPRDTIQNHLCLLPFQEGILIRYAQLLALTIIVLAVRARRYNHEEAAYNAMSLPTHASQDEKDRPYPSAFARKVTPPGSPHLVALHSHTSSTASTNARARGNNHNGTFLNGNGNSNNKSNLNGYNSVTHPLSRSASPGLLDPSTASERKIGIETDDWGNPITRPNSANHNINNDIIRTYTPPEPSYPLPSSSSTNKRHKRGYSDPYPTLASSSRRYGYGDSSDIINQFSATLNIVAGQISRRTSWLTSAIQKPSKTRRGEFVKSFLLVCVPALAFYLCLVCNG